VVVVLASGSGAGVLAYSSVKDQATTLQVELTAYLQAGQSELDAAKSSLLEANTKHDQALIAQANVHFIAAKVHFMVARQIADSSHLLNRLETMPEVGGFARSRHVAVDAIADIGVAISDAGRELADLDGQLIKPATTSGQEGRTLLTVLNQTKSSLVKVREDFIRAQAAAALVDVQVLPANQRNAFTRAKATIATALGAVEEFNRLAPVLTELVGGNGARTYLIEQVNPAELRAGGGFLGTFSVIQADHGTMKLIRSGRGPDLSYPRASPGQAGYVTPPGPFREWLPNTSWSFQDSNFFPDFPSNALAARTFAEPRLGTRIDGVMAIDFYAVTKMLELTGPLPVPGSGITVDANNFIPLVIQHDLAGDSIDKTLLSAIAGPLMERVATLPTDRWPALIAALNDLASARHLQAYFTDASVEKEMDQVGWSGVLNPTGARDYMMEVESNLGGTKANYFVTRHFTIDLTRNGMNLHHRVTIDIRDDMPFSYRPGEYYSAYVRLYIGDSALSATNNLRGARYPNPAPPAGTRMSDGWVPLFHGYGHSGQAVFEFDTPWVVDGRGQHSIYWQKQPGTLNDKVDVRWNDGSGHTYATTGDLAQDRVLVMSARGVMIAPGQPARAQLPSLGLG